MIFGLDTLPPDLRDFVKEDNKHFEKELEEWDAQVSLKAQQEKISPVPRVPMSSTAQG